ncbi:MAG: LysR family transcriptional regulator, partial [Fusobacterium sp.]
MLDYKIITFLKLCETMNYHITGEELHMTQPSVTNHIQSLEREYNCKLFIYNNKKLHMTKEASILKNYATAAYYNDLELRNNLNKSNKTKIRMGATKTIGDFVVKDNIVNFLKNENYEFSLIVDNTEHLLKSLDDLELWPNKVKVMQKNWIGKSLGAEIKFKIHSQKELINIFTTIK